MSVALAVMPQGVEHNSLRETVSSVSCVALAVMPQGVEHFPLIALVALLALSSPSP